MLRFSSFLVFVLTCCAGCLAMSDDTDTRPVDRDWEQFWTGTPDAKSPAAGTNRFALDLYAQLRTQDGNLFFSPYSISTALAMTSAGARGPTLDEMARVLHFPDQAALHPAMAALTAGIRQRAGKDIELATANALWGQQGRAFRDDFLSLTRKYYGSGFREVDFIGDAESARRSINDWTERQTHRHIRELLPPGVLTTDTRLVSTNAVYFKAKWDKAFDKGNTRDEDFVLRDGTRARTPLMRQTDVFGYAEADRLQILEMPYAGGEVSLVILLPHRRSTLDDLEKRMPEELISWLAELPARTVIVKIPRFEMTLTVSLKDTLSRMGMARAFSKEADFSGIDAGRDRLRVGNVIHKAFVEVGEEGTEAAAATAVEMAVPTAAPDMQLQPPPPEFIADHPFVYLIRDRQTGCILFMGRYVGK